MASSRAFFSLFDIGSIDADANEKSMNG